jgi:hypothetical protein
VEEASELLIKRLEEERITIVKWNGSVGVEVNTQAAWNISLPG